MELIVKKNELDYQKDREEALNILIDKNDSKSIFSDYCKSYLFTTENIRAYLLKLNNPSNALTVLGSGDQVFNLFRKNIYEVDSFDINKLSYYIFFLKYAVIKTLDYSGFKRVVAKLFYLNNHNKFIDLIDNCKQNMPIEVYNFFMYLLNKRLEYYNLTNEWLDFTELIRLDEITRYEKVNNIYANTEDEYKLLKRNMELAKMTMYFEDARFIPKMVDKKYDLILLSNVADYLGNYEHTLTVDEFNEYINSFRSILSQNGELINYLFCLLRTQVVKNSEVTINDLDHSCLFEIDDYEGFYRVRKTQQ